MLYSIELTSNDNVFWVLCHLAIDFWFPNKICGRDPFLELLCWKTKILQELQELLQRFAKTFFFSFFVAKIWASKLQYEQHEDKSGIMLDILCSWNLEHKNILSSLFGKIIKFSQCEHEEMFPDLLRMLTHTRERLFGWTWARASS